MSNLDYSCELYSFEFFVLCALGGIFACGVTHTMITPLDCVKCRLQVDPNKYKNLMTGIKVSLTDGGLPNLWKGWAPTFCGYSLQGAGKFTGYEFLKYKFSSWVDEATAYYHRVPLYLLAAACAELGADVMLAPFEATKVRMQTIPGYTFKMHIAIQQMWREEGIMAFYRGLPPLWARQVLYTMMKFASFERTLEWLYEKVVPKAHEECTKGEQLLVTFAAGYIAGVMCALVSHPADTIVSKLNKDPKATIHGIIADLGLCGIWRGLIARIVMIGTLTGMQWLLYDGFKIYTKMPRPPPPEPPSLSYKDHTNTVKNL